MAAMLGLDPNKNYSYFTIPAAFLLLMVPHTLATAFWGRNWYDPAQPRKFLNTLASDEACDKILKRRIARAEAATANGTETIGLYAAAVIAANVSGVPAGRLNYLCLGYLASRVAYNLIYVWAQDNRKLAPFRSLAWTVGITLVLALFILAGMESL